MHSKYYIIVYENNEKEALVKAINILNRLTHESNSFDYFHDIQQPVNVNSEEGKKLIEKGMNATEKEFYNAITKVRNTIENYTDKEIFNEQDQDGNCLDLVRYYFGIVGMYKGPEIYMYDNDGEGIDNQNHLKSVLNKYASLYENKKRANPYKDKEIFVIPTMMHY